MSFFRKINRGVGNIFRKGVQEPVGSFFRKEGGLDQFSVGLRKMGNTFQESGKGVRQFSSNPVITALGNALGSYYGNPLLGTQIRDEGKLIGDSLTESGDMLKLGRDATNRKNYNSLERS
jgi:hypothetical protein